MKTDAQILFSRIRNVCLNHPYRSERFKHFVRELTTGCEFHHIAGSVHGMKSTDLFGVAVRPEIHAVNQNNLEWNIDLIPEAIHNLFLYVEYLETKTNHKIIIKE